MRPYEVGNFCRDRELWPNSSGTTDDHARYWARNFKKPLYFVSEMRQSDHVSCYIDALTFILKEMNEPRVRAELDEARNGIY